MHKTDAKTIASLCLGGSSTFLLEPHPESRVDRTRTDDNELLAEIGYKAELGRKFNTVQVFGVAFSIMGLLPSISSVLGLGLEGGPAGLVWGWFIASFFILLIGVAMAELGSAMPTSGGLYYWTNYYANDNWKTFLSFLVGNVNSLALVGGFCSINYGFAGEILSIVVISKGGDFTITSGMTYGVFAACVISHIIVTLCASSGISKLQSFSIVCNVGLIVLFLIAIPIGTARSPTQSFNDAGFIFGSVKSMTGWTPGWQFVLCWMPAIWTICSFDSCVHMSEEAKNATRAVPIGIVGSISVCYVLGLVICIVIGACMTQDIDSIVGTKLGQPMAQIIFNALGKKWAMAFMTLIAFCQWLMGASILTAISRQIWAFSRDNGLPFSGVIKVVNQKWSVPIRAVIFGGILSLIIGLLCLIGPTASNALFSLGVAGNYFSWGTPILLRLTCGRAKFVPGKFYMGDFWSPVISWTAFAFLAFVIVMIHFPSIPVVNKETMNYTCVITPGVMILSSIYYVLYAKNYYYGPRKTVDDAAIYGVALGESSSDVEVVLAEKKH
ncbi:hypothetical protein BABINDRAFT_159909 [Babjeviella inositovora NRRL Y-12698]|uniref:Amino acid permease/ SLC12A domain-containing protein n=1 Tax=Babjeviella inositovora NRRL Y-12698 TaxID=984486 RepID=A0A1E3QVF9_9ASCO|nr:uncharacterized protein BABINDRAFT_159909 [Babjeviella inositovora NRRL Y-12698]ODQ81646.1 hypothetical protein BABINDRAFT_159909 [Babjeviella inositovora NRRL Y-12698]